MDALEAIFSRRSIRQYRNEMIPDEIIQQILEAAMSAPSARNTQPWHFVVIKDRSLLNRITEIHPYAQMLKEAPLAIAVCGDTGLEANLHYLNQNCSAATQNMLLAAHALGLGAVWLGIFPRERRVTGLKNLLQIPDQIIPISLISLGYPAEEKGPINRFNALRIHSDHW